jgi:DNA-binding NtrC family response regulator
MPRSRAQETEEIAEGHMPYHPRAQKQIEKSGIATRGNALVVDEDPADLVYYRTVLQRAGCEVVACNSYEEALDCLGADEFDLIVLSQGSSAFEGRKVLEKAIAVDRDRQVLVVARVLNMSCYLEAMQLGARDYLEEPVREQEMVRAVETCLTSRAVAA